jgi:predicted transcriptional regulator
MADSTIMVHLDASAQARLAALAEARCQPVSEVAAEVLATYLAPESWEQAHIRAGLEELEAGKAIPHEQVAAWLDSWGTDNELPAPE